MKVRWILGIAIASAFVLAAAVEGQNDATQEFGMFKTECKTDQMTDVRSCNVSLSPGPQYYLDHGVPVFLVYFTPADGEITSVGFAGRMRIDKNPALIGKCIDTSTGLYLFRDKKANNAFIKELTSGVTLHVETGSKILDFDLADYKKALAAYNEMRKPSSASSPK